MEYTLEPENTTKTPTLQPKTINIINTEIETPPKTNKQKITFICKHPDKEEPIRISKVKYIKNNKQITTSGTWISTNEQGQILTNSALGQLLTHYKIKNPKDLKTAETTTDDKNYLIIKAYN